jgi:paraquat-inducible protein A
MNRYLLLTLHTASLVLLFFGWTLDMLQIDVSAEFIVSINLFNEKRSVLGTLTSLFESGNYFPFFLILLFGIIVPVVKSAAIYYLLIAKNAAGRWYLFVKAISKWAMADVYAISIFVAFLGAKSMQNTRAVLLPGFYYFAAYVLVSAVIAALLGKLMGKAARTAPATVADLQDA